MAKKQSRRAEKARAEIESLKAARRQDLLKMAIACFAMVVLIIVKTALEYYYILEQGNMIVGGAMVFIAFGLAVFAGSAGVNFAKSGRRIKELSGGAASAK